LPDDAVASGRSQRGAVVAQIVGVHGVGQQHQGEHRLYQTWYPALLDGLARAGVSSEDVTLACAFYGDLFRPPGQPMAVGDPWYTADDVEPGIEVELVTAWWAGAAQVDQGVVPPGAEVMARTPHSVQQALLALSNSRFFAGLAERALIFDLKQVRRYLTEPTVRQAAIGRVAEAVTKDTRVLVGHSLGSVVAYEALCAHRDDPGWSVHTLVTLGSPLGIRRLIFDRLQPPPALGSSGGEPQGCWPGDVAWVNIADAGDVVALVKDLRPMFGDRVEGWLIDNGATAHDIGPYLTAAETGRAIGSALS
jgi:hypothetical protein